MEIPRSSHERHPDQYQQTSPSSNEIGRIAERRSDSFNFEAKGHPKEKLRRINVTRV